MKCKRFLSVLLAVALFLALATPVAAASQFKDLNGHWAQTYMEDLAERGYLTGYSDGTMKPEGNITACEALAFLSRFYTLSESEMEYLYKDYGPSAESVVPAALSWAYDEVAVCLAAGITTVVELVGMDLSAPIEKERLAVFLTRAIQQETAAKALSIYPLTFADTADITSSCQRYVYLLVQAGIITGDNNNKFGPHLSVTRAVVSAMVSRALDYAEKRGFDLSLEEYSGISQFGGIILEASGQSLTVRNLEGMAQILTIPADATVQVNGTAKTLSDSEEGCYVAITEKEGVITKVAVEKDEDVRWVQGVITSVKSISGKNLLTIRSMETGGQTTYTIPSTAAITENDEKVVFTGLSKNYFATLEIEKENVTQVLAMEGDYTLSGSITELTYGTTITLKIKAEDGSSYCFLLDIADLPDVERGDRTITIDRLNVGDSVTVKVSSCVVETLSTVGTQSSITGELTAVTTTAEGTKWTITPADGTAQIYTVDDTAGVWSGSEAILLSAVKIGDTVTVFTFGSEITEINLDTAVSAAEKITGTVLYVDIDEDLVTILSSGKLIYVDASELASIISAETGKTVRLSALEADCELVLYGSYTSSTAFTAKSIIVERWPAML